MAQISRPLPALTSRTAVDPAFMAYTRRTALRLCPTTNEALPSVSGSSQYRCGVLAVDNDPQVLALLREVLSGEFDLVCCRTAEEAKEVLAVRSADVVLTGQELPGQSGVL